MSWRAWWTGLALLLWCVAAAAQHRIPTAVPTLEDLRAVFPAGGWFSAHEGTPLHYTAYESNADRHAGGKPLGFVFWTTDLVPQERGYHGAIHILVGLDVLGTITGVRVGYNREPYGDFSVDPPEFAQQFRGKRLSDPFVVGRDVHAVSRATLTIGSATRAIRDSGRAVARALLPAYGERGAFLR